MAAVMKSVMAKFLMTVDDMLPARVLAYDDATGFATVQPIVQVGTTSGAKVSRAPIANIKTLRMGAGGFFIRFPIKAGDLGWIKANDRDISLILQSSGGEDWPNTKRLHSFSDALFIPDTFRGWAIDGGNIDALVIQSMDGTVCISVHNDKVHVRGPQLIADISGQTVVNCPNVEFNASMTTFNSDITINGNQTWNGTNSTFNNGGEVNILGGTLLHNGANIGSSHVHPILGGSSAPGPTGGPQ